MNKPISSRAYAWSLNRLERQGEDPKRGYRVHYVGYFSAPSTGGNSFSRSRRVRTNIHFYAPSRTGLLVIHEVLGKPPGRNIPMTEAALTVALQSYHRQPLHTGSKVLVSDTALFGDLI